MLASYHSLMAGSQGRELLESLRQLQSALCEFHCHRGVWAQIVANNAAPGRGSEFQKRLEIEQYNALQTMMSFFYKMRDIFYGPETIQSLKDRIHDLERNQPGFKYED